MYILSQMSRNVLVCKAFLGKAVDLTWNGKDTRLSYSEYEQSIQGIAREVTQRRYSTSI